MLPRFLRVISLLICLGVLCAGCDKPRRESTSRISAKVSDEEQVKAGELLEFRLPDLSGNAVSLADFRGKVVLLNFWATWCAPCVAEMPALERLYQTYRDKGFEIVAISMDSEDNDQVVKDFVKEQALSFPILRDRESSIPPELGITGYPETFFVGPDGTILRFLDPHTKKSTVRIISDRPWDAPVFIKAIGALLEKHSVDDPNNT